MAYKTDCVHEAIGRAEALILAIVNGVVGIHAVGPPGWTMADIRDKLVVNGLAYRLAS